MNSEVVKVARDFIQLFEELSINYAMIGGFAVRVHALPRPTFDVDYVALLSDEKLEELLVAAEKRGYCYPDALKTGWMDRVRGMPVMKFHYFIGDKAIDADVFLVESEYQQSIIARRIRCETDGIVGWFATAEDLILLKLMAERTRDRADVADVLFVSGRLDVAYMRRWAKELGVSDSLESALESEAAR